MFTKGDARNGYSTIYLEENDIADEKNLEAMLVRGITRNPEDYKAALGGCFQSLLSLSGATAKPNKRGSWSYLALASSPNLSPPQNPLLSKSHQHPTQ